MGTGALFVAVFLACIVEAVEATTIVLAAGTTREWRSTLIGVGAGLVSLAVVVAVLGPAVSALPLDVLRLVVGALLLVFGLQWLRKSILRASGYKALHDEDADLPTQVEAAQAAGRTRRGLVGDWYAFTLAFKGVLLEGLEVVFIVLTFGSQRSTTCRWRRSPPARRGPGRRRRHRRSGAAGPGAGERDEVRRRRHADRVRGLLGRRRGRGRLAGRRCAPCSCWRRRSPPSACWSSSGCAGGGRARPSGRRRGPGGRRDVMARLKAFGAFWYDFVVGDDWVRGGRCRPRTRGHRTGCQLFRTGMVDRAGRDRRPSPAERLAGDTSTVKVVVAPLGAKRAT